MKFLTMSHIRRIRAKYNNEVFHKFIKWKNLFYQIRNTKLISHSYQEPYDTSEEHVQKACLALGRRIYRPEEPSQAQ